MHFVTTEDLREKITGASALSTISRGLGGERVSASYLEDELGLPLHVRFALQKLAETDGEVEDSALWSLPFYSLCKGLLLPLSGMSPEKVASLFSITADPAPNAREREALVEEFLDKDVGLSLTDKIACILGDPFRGRRSTFRRDSCLRILQGTQMVSRRELLDRLHIVGDVAVLFSESRPRLREKPSLTAAEVIAALRFIPDEKRADKLAILRALLDRMGKLEAFFLAKLLLRSARIWLRLHRPPVESRHRDDIRSGS